MVNGANLNMMQRMHLTCQHKPVWLDWDDIRPSLLQIQTTSEIVLLLLASQKPTLHLCTWFIVFINYLHFFRTIGRFPSMYCHICFMKFLNTIIDLVNLINHYYLHTNYKTLHIYHSRNFLLAYLFLFLYCSS